MRVFALARSAAAVAVVGMVLMIGAPAAMAKYQGGATLTVSDAHPACGSTITVSGAGFTPNASVRVKAQGLDTRVTASATGTFSVPYTTRTQPCRGLKVQISATDGVNRVRVTIINGTRPPKPPVTTTSVPATTSSNPVPTTVARAAMVPLAALGFVLLARRRRSAVG